eukprot:5780293-Amphidinium_carterae.2
MRLQVVDVSISRGKCAACSTARASIETVSFMLSNSKLSSDATQADAACKRTHVKVSEGGWSFRLTACGHS